MSFVKTRRDVSFLFKGLVVAVAFGALTACSEEKKAEAPEIVRPVKVTEVAAADHGRRLQYSGSVKARTEMNLGFRVAGKITERLVDVGQRVRPGDVLAKLDAVDYQLAVRRAEADLASAQKQVEISGLARRRAETLVEKSISSQSQFEQAQLANDQAVSQKESAQSALDQARNQVAYTELKSDQNGIITAVSADIGQVVASGTPVLSVAVEGSKEVQIAVPEMDVAHFKPGKTVKASFWSATDLVLDGKVREVAGSADAQSRTFAVRVSLPDDPRVLLGMTATIEADEDNAVATYAIPLAALSKKDGQSVVWIVDRGKGTVSSRAVKVADFSDDGVRVAEGVAKGDLVVSAGTQFMKEDMKVKLPETIASRFGSVSSLTTASLAP
ncbi:RND family efflux transporter MFP subunit [Neorhizobium galegae]|uniref:efflux RND transporter periplasmic adaptor subunit n=1 Tax=Neorhizobium galegae TaxID=399 RepID=UPI001AE7555C|nr:efflux RND transporter periplasmic adaptor subunit [Neorhizobium galegae]MBP2557599.1 RND family efflux transporter MFP subunit [Neorhizobium galegae]MDQ0136441.1 RND family efflux transporter MFP subunit [Neorhizobium galegae]